MRITVIRLGVIVFCFAGAALSAMAQKPNPTSSFDTFSVWIAKHLAPSVVVIKAGANGVITQQGTGIVIRADGVILTAYHVLKDTKQVQVTTKEGETYDSVEILGIDERRDVVALRIPLKDMSPIVTRAVTDESIGERVFSISNPQNMNWTIADGLLSGLRLADEVQGAGKGYKLLQFTAPASPGSSGGLLVDVEGRGIGLIVGTLGGQQLNFAVPLQAVIGLADQGGKALLSGGLTLTQKEPTEPEKIEDRKGKAVAVAEATRTDRIREARLMYVERKTRLCKPVMLHNALMKHAAQLDEWNIKMVDSSALADIVVEVDNMPMTFFYTYSITDKRAGVLLGAGRIIAWDCNLAAPGLAKQIIQTLGHVHQPPKSKEVNKADTR